MSRLTWKALADGLGLSRQMCQRHVAAGMPRYDLEAARAWYRAQVEQRGDAGDPSPDLTEARRRKIDAERALVEIDLAKARGEVVEVAEMERAWANVCDRMRARLMAVPGKYAPRLRLPMPEAMAVLEDVVGDVIDELAGRTAA